MMEYSSRHHAELCGAARMKGGGRVQEGRGQECQSRAGPSVENK